MTTLPATTSSSPPPRYLLDTNILILYARGKEAFRRVEENFSITASAAASQNGGSGSAPLVSLVSVAEVTAIALYRDWGDARRARFQSLLNELVIVPVDGPDLVNRYARIDVFSRRSGRTMGKNDLWIATAANLTGATLLTTDKDFDHLHDTFLTREWISP